MKKLNNKNSKKVLALGMSTVSVLSMGGLMLFDVNASSCVVKPLTAYSEKALAENKYAVCVDENGFQYGLRPDGTAILIQTVDHKEIEVGTVVVVPDSVSIYGKTYKVTDIGDSFLSCCHAADDVIIPPTVNGYKSVNGVVYEMDKCGKQVRLITEAARRFYPNGVPYAEFVMIDSRTGLFDFSGLPANEFSDFTVEFSILCGMRVFLDNETLNSDPVYRATLESVGERIEVTPEGEIWEIK